MYKRLIIGLLVAASTTAHATDPNNSFKNNMKFKLYEKMIGLYKSQGYYQVRKYVNKPDKSNTILGKDNNNNGIRDDVENYIDKTYSGVSQNKAAKQLARSMQSSLSIDTTDKTAVKRASYMSSRAITCVHDYFKDGDSIYGTSIVDDIGLITMNTYQRYYAMNLFDSALDGSVISLPESDYCDF